MHVEDLKILCQYVRQYFEKVLMPVDQAILTQAPAAGLPSVATDDDRPERKAMVYTVTRHENIYTQPVLEPEYGNALAVNISDPSTSSYRRFAGPTYSDEELTNLYTSVSPIQCLFATQK